MKDKTLSRAQPISRIPFADQLLPYPHLRVREIHLSDEIEIIAKPVEEGTLHCHVCGSQSAGVHRKLTRKVRDLHILDRKVWLKRPYRRINCGQCEKIRRQKLHITRDQKETSNRLSRYVSGLKSRGIDKRSIEESLDLDWATVDSFIEQPASVSGPIQNREVTGIDLVPRNDRITELVFADFNTGGDVWSKPFWNEKDIPDWIAGFTESNKEMMTDQKFILMCDSPLLRGPLIDQLGTENVVADIGQIG